MDNDCDFEIEESELEAGDAIYAMFFRCSHILKRRVGVKISRQRILQLLDKNGEMTQCEIRRKLGIQAGSFSELAARLEALGYITRERDLSDKRKMNLKLTERGRKKAKLTAPAKDRELFSALTEDEREELRAMLRKIIDAHNEWKIWHSVN